MRKLLVVSVVCSVSFVLAGCATWWPWGNSGAQGCSVQFKQGGTWSIAGIDIPINHPLVGTIKIGKVNYTGPDYSHITQTIYALDQARLGYCSLTTSPYFPTLTQSVRDDTFKKAAASYTAIVNFGIGLQAANTPEEGLNAQKAAAQVANEVKPLPPGAYIDNDARVAAAAASNMATAAFTEVAGLRVQIGELEQSLAEAGRRGVHRMRIIGYEPNGVALMANQKNAVLSDFEKAIASVPNGRTPMVLLIGYADGSGPRASNTDLALQRAANVADFLRRHDFGRDFHTEVTSGGVATQSRGDHARRVDIVVSQLTLVAQIS